jgi:PAS domain S-box-containing protein
MTQAEPKTLFSSVKIAPWKLWSGPIVCLAIIVLFESLVSNRFLPSTILILLAALAAALGGIRAGLFAAVVLIGYLFWEYNTTPETIRAFPWYEDKMFLLSLGSLILVTALGVGWLRELQIKLLASLSNYKVLQKEKEIELEQLALEKKKHEEGELLYKTIASNFPGGTISLSDRNMVVLFVEGRELAKAGYSSKDFVGKTISEIFPPETARVLEANYRKAFEGYTAHFEVDLYQFKYTVRIVPLYEANGSIERILVVSQNISKNYTIRKELEYQRAYLRQIIDTVPHLIFIRDANGQLVVANKALADASNNTPESVVANNAWRDPLSPEEIESYLASDQEVIRTRQTLQREETYTNKDTGKVTHYLDIKKPFLSPEGKTHVLSVALDITPLKLTEEKLKKALHEREMLIKEVYHRVKNNMATISGLLSLQARYVSDPQAREAFQASQNRIHGMVLVHEQLYRSESLSSVNLGEYLQMLIGNLRNTYQSKEKEIRIGLVTCDVEIDSEKAIACGLLLSELVSNAFKHAFKDMENGEILIELTEANGICKLKVSDNGVGILPGTDIMSSNSLGMKLVDHLVSQLRANLEIQNAKGTTFLISFTA